uniref:Ovochymase-2 n=1 Tax=Lygus hesperus TaxID=30085 RepID=A0A0A9XUV2_LYGHE
MVQSNFERKMIVSILCVSLQLFTYSLARSLNDNLIIGGKFAHIEDFPFVVAILIKDKHLCGGTLLSTLYVLTACHCVVKPREALPGDRNIPLRNYKDIRLKAGTVNEKSQISGSIRGAGDILKHPECAKSLKGWTYDIGMVVSKERFPLIPGKIQPLPLPSFQNISLPEMSANETDCIAVGWGRTQEDTNKTSSYLLKAELQLMAMAACERRLEVYGMETETDLRFQGATQICTIGVEGKGRVPRRQWWATLCDSGFGVADTCVGEPCYLQYTC